MARVYQLLPGDIVTTGGESATFIASEPHPKYPKLKLVIWKLHRDNSWSLDALLWNQEVGEIIPSRTREEMWEEVQKAFGGSNA